MQSIAACFQPSLLFGGVVLSPSKLILTLPPESTSLQILIKCSKPSTQASLKISRFREISLVPNKWVSFVLHVRKTRIRKSFIAEQEEMERLMKGFVIHAKHSAGDLTGILDALCSKILPPKPESWKENIQLFCYEYLHLLPEKARAAAVLTSGLKGKEAAELTGLSESGICVGRSQTSSESYHKNKLQRKKGKNSSPLPMRNRLFSRDPSKQ